MVHPTTKMDGLVLEGHEGGLSLGMGLLAIEPNADQLVARSHRMFGCAGGFLDGVGPDSCVSNACCAFDSNAKG